MSKGEILRLYPAPSIALPLQGLYLRENLLQWKDLSKGIVYSNYIVSLDGRIAVEQPEDGRKTIPQSITNPRDWRLFQELAAQADALLTSGRYVRQLAEGTAQDSFPVSDAGEYADLFLWRQEQGLAPQPAVIILSKSLIIPNCEWLAGLERPVYVATGAKSDPHRREELKDCGLRVLIVGPEENAIGHQLIAKLQTEGFASIYAMAGPEVLETLLRDRLLDRLYLTQVHRLLGGRLYDTLLEGPRLEPPANFVLDSLYYDTAHESGQLFSVYQRE